MKLGIAGFRAMTPSAINESWDRVGLWLMDFRFVRLAEEKRNSSLLFSRAIEEEGSSSNVINVLKNIDDLMGSVGK